MPVTDIWRSRFDRLRGVRKLPSVFHEKKAQISATAISRASILYWVNSCLILCGFMLRVPC